MEELPSPIQGFTIQQEEKPEHCEEHGDYVAKGYQIGRTMRWMACPVCSRAKQEAERAEEEAGQVRAQQKRIEESLDMAGIPLRYRTKDFASFKADTDGKELALSIAMEFAQNFEQHAKLGTVAVFSGLPGTGKSHLAIAIAQHVMKRHSALYASAIDAVRAVRDAWRKDSDRTESQVLSKLARVELLVLDEIGVQYGTESEQITLFDIIDKRYRDMMPTILLTNQNRKGMKDFLGDRSFDRLREGGIWVKFDWESQRGVS